MTDFKSLQDIWEHTNEKVPEGNFLRKSSGIKSKLIRELTVGAVMLFLTGIFNLWMALFVHLNFVHWYTYTAMILIVIVCLGQALLLVKNRQRLTSISETDPPIIHLKRWKDYYQLRSIQNRWNGPLYFIALNVAFAIYFIESFAALPRTYVVVFVVLYMAWMLFAYFILGPKVLTKEKRRLTDIINELESISQELTER